MANVSKFGIGIKVAKNGLTIPYLMFVDNCLIFGKATRSATRNEDILENYCNILGQLVPTWNSINTYLGCMNIDHKRTRGDF